MLMKNFTAKKEDLNGISILKFTDEEGHDWYESQSLFSSSSLKIMFDAEGNIVSSSYDASMLAPDGLSVGEIKKKDIPDKFFDYGKRWLFDNGQIVELPVDHIAEAQTEKEILLKKVSDEISPLQDALDLNIATDAEKARLDILKRYRISVNRVDVISGENINWPEKP